jgi:hypothetical protein
MRRPFTILFLLLGLAACAAQDIPTAMPPAPAVPPLHGGMIYTQVMKIKLDPSVHQGWEQQVSRAVVVDEHGQLVHTLPLSNTIASFPTRAPNKAIYQTAEGYFLVDAAQGTLQRLPMSQTNPNIPLIPSSLLNHLGRRWMLMEERRGGILHVPSRVTYLIDLERGTAVDINALMDTQFGLGSFLQISPDENYLLAPVESKGWALIPTAAPERWRILSNSEAFSQVGFAPDSQSILYTTSNGVDSDLILARLDGGQQTTLISGAFDGWISLRDPNQILLAMAGGLLKFNLSTGERHSIDQCAESAQIIMSDDDTHALCSASYMSGWQAVDLATGAVTALPELEWSGPRSASHQRWVVFGTLLGGDVVYSRPTQIVDLHTGRIVVRVEHSKIIDVAPDASAVLVGDDRLSNNTLWLYNSDGTSYVINDTRLSARAQFSPDGQQIAVSNLRYQLIPFGNPIRVFDRMGLPVRRVGRNGIDPVWLER